MRQVPLGQSVNSKVLKGIGKLSMLTIVILRFSENSFAFSEDIEQMFMQVKAIS